MLDRGSLNKKFEGFGSTPNDALWGNISANLDAKKRKKRGIIWWTFGTGIAASLLLSFLLFNPTRSVDQSIGEITEQAIDKTTPSKTTLPSDQPVQTTSPDVASPIIEVPNQLQATPEYRQNPVQSSGIDKGNLATQNPPQSENIPDRILIASTDQIPTEKVNISPLPIGETPMLLAANTRFSNAEIPIEKPKRSGKWDLGFHLQHQSGWPRTYEPPLTSITPGSFNDADNNGIIYNAPEINTPPPTIIKITTGRPINLRGHIGYHLNRRLALQSGIDLGLIRSSLQFANSPSSTIKTTLLSTGIPLALNVKFWQRNRMNFSYKLGVLNEWLIYSQHQTPTAALDISGNNNKVKTWGINQGFLSGIETGFNLNFSLNERLSFALNPGAKWYYFQTINISQPLVDQSFFTSLSGGLKWHLR